MVGCEPASVDEGIGLSPPVAAAVDEAVRIVLDLVDAELPRAVQAHRSATAPGEAGRGEREGVRCALAYPVR